MTNILNNRIVAIVTLSILALFGLMVASPMIAPEVQFAPPAANLDQPAEGDYVYTMDLSDAVGAYTVSLTTDTEIAQLAADAPPANIPFPNEGKLTIPIGENVAYVSWQCRPQDENNKIHIEFGRMWPNGDNIAHQANMYTRYQSCLPENIINFLSRRLKELEEYDPMLYQATLRFMHMLDWFIP